MNEKDTKLTEVVNYLYNDKFEMEDLEGRRLYLNSQVDESIVDTVVYHILRYNRLDKDIPREERKPIILYINTQGGSVSDGFSLIDTILSSKTPVYTVNLALAASMGFLIYIAGHKRYSMPHAEFLMHDGSTMGYDSVAKMRDRMEFEAIALENEIRKYVMNQTKIDEELYNEKYRCEWYFLPQTGKEIGAVDYIVNEDCDIDEIT